MPALRKLLSKLHKEIVRRVKASPPPGITEAAKSDLAKQISIDKYVSQVVLDAKDKIDFEKLLEEALADQVKRQFIDSGRKVYSTIGVSFDKDFYDRISNGYLKERLYDKGVLFTIRDSALNQAKSTMGAMYKEGSTISEYAQALMETFDGAQDYQAERIARTEMFLAQSMGTMAGWADQGVDQFEFQIAPDACPVCQAIARGGSPGDYGKVAASRAGENYRGNPYTMAEIKELGPFGDGLPHPNCEDAWLPFIPPDKLRRMMEGGGGD